MEKKEQDYWSDSAGTSGLWLCTCGLAGNADSQAPPHTYWSPGGSYLRNSWGAWYSERSTDWFLGPDSGEDPEPDSNSDTNQLSQEAVTVDEESNQREITNGFA